jgi:transketolase
MAVLLDKYLRYDYGRPDDPNNDHLIFSKGHASPLLYALYAAAGAISDEELLTLRRLGSRLEGHPSPVLPWVDIATGSLGFGLPVGVGIALAAKTVDPRPYRVWVLVGDSEMAEGSVWEAFEHAAYWGLDNLTVILDVNRLGQSGETRLAAAGWCTRRRMTRSRSPPPGSPSTKRSERPSDSPKKGSSPACSTSTRSSRSTEKPCSTHSR